MKTKICKGCKTAKCLSQFDPASKNSRSADKLRGECKQCYSAYCRSPKIVEKNRRRFLKKLYGITLEQYNEMFQAQDGKCALCLKSTHRNLDVDHNHITGVVRGLLCPKCNKGLGLFKVDESPDLLSRALIYVTKVR